MEEYHEADFDVHPLIDAAAKIQEDRQVLKTARDKDFNKRAGFLKNYFLLMSSPKKIKMIIKFLEHLHFLEDVLLIISYMHIASKESVLRLMDPFTNFVYDKDIFFDHDRMLDKDTLEQTLESDLEWFVTIQPRRQVKLIIELLKRAGGNVRRTLYIPLLRKYHETLKAIQLDPTMYSAPTREIITNPIKPDYEHYNPYHPATIEVEKQRKKWEAMINKYRSEVEKEEKKLKNQPEGNISKTTSRSSIGSTNYGKSEKSKKSKGKGKGKGKDKKSKGKGKGKGKGKLQDELDWLQLLPIWIVKKIFGYLDQKTLKNLRKVNGYHEYVVQDLLKEMKMRKKLDSTVMKLQAEIKPEKLAEAMNTERRLVYKLPRQINKEEVGVISSKLVPKKREPFAETSLIVQAAMESGDYLPNEVATFPRIIKEDMLLYRYQPCFLKDVNLVLGARDDEQSFITYSSKSVTDSSSISVDEVTLQDW